MKNLNLQFPNECKTGSKYQHEAWTNNRMAHHSDLILFLTSFFLWLNRKERTICQTISP